MRPPRLLASVCGLAAAGCLALAGCSAGADGPEATPAATDTAQPTTHRIDGTPLSIALPAGWDWSTRDKAQVTRAPAATGTPPLRPNVVILVEPATRTLESEGALTATFAEGVEGWVTDADGQGPTTIGDLPAFRLTGTFEAKGVEVAQAETIVEVGSGEQRSFVYLTASAAVDDADGTAAAASVVESLTATPEG